MDSHESMMLPELIVAADWSVQGEKRWMARAELQHDGRYEIQPPEPVGEVASLLDRLQSATKSGRVLLGLDFPIGLPLSYARQLPFSHFREAAAAFGHGDWNCFFTRSETPGIRQPFFPTPSLARQKGDFRKQLAAGLNVSDWKDLLRECERATADRPAAECLFFTCGGKQVGAAASVGWQELLQPALNDIQLWPFDGDLHDLLQRVCITIAEVYPAEAYRPFGLRTSRIRLSKRNRDSRRESCRLSQLRANPAWTFSSPALSWLEWGYLSDDDFDATVGLLFTILVVTRQIPAFYPHRATITNWEGWILGQQPSG